MPESFELSPGLSSATAPTDPPSEREELRPPADCPAAPAGTLTIFQANLLVAMLAGFWGRKADGHPGPDLVGRGLAILATLVQWERLKAQSPAGHHPCKDPPPSPGLRSSTDPPQQIPTNRPSPTRPRLIPITNFV